MKAPHWLSAFVPCFVSKELLPHLYSQQSAWRSQPVCLRSPVVGEMCAGASSQTTWQERFERVGKNIYRPLGAPWLIELARPLRPCPVSLAQLSLGSWVHWERLRLGSQTKIVGLGHCCGDPASRDRSGLGSETITKEPQGHPLHQRPQGPSFLLCGPSRPVVSPLTYRRCQLRWLSSCPAKAAALVSRR